MRRGLLFAIIVLVVFSRFAFLDLRILHHDEGVNYFFADNILSGEGFRYDPNNYHGTFYFFILALSFLILGINEVSLRIPAAIAGIAIVLVPFMLKVKDRYKPYVFSLFLLFMPSLLFYSRYSIHESSFVLFSMISVYLLTRIIEEKSLEKLPYFVLCLALLFAIKETVLIFLFCVLLMIIANIQDLKQISFGKKELRIALLSILLFLAVYVLFFSSFLTNLGGVIDSFKGFMPWIERGVSEKGHDKALYYYLLLLLKYELPLMILGVIALFSFRRLRESVFAKNAAIWFVSSFFVYSFIGYKTPWLLINLSVPLALLAAIGISEIRGKKTRYVLLFSSLAYLAFFSAYLNFYVPWQETNSYAYVHTDMDILSMINDLRENVDLNESIIVTSRDYWPLPFYLRDYKRVFYSEGVFDKRYFEQYDAVIMNVEQARNEGIDEGGLSRVYLLREGVELRFVRTS